MNFSDVACLGSAASAAMEAIDWMEFGTSSRVLLILGGASDVGSCAILYCKAKGYTVHATANGQEACEWCRRLGADRVINTDEGDGRWIHCFKDHTVDGIFETRGAPHNFQDAERVLRKTGGCFASIAPKEGHTLADAASFLPSYLWRKLVSPFHYFTFTEYDVSSPKKLAAILKLSESGVFRSITNGVYNFDLISVQKAFGQVFYDVTPGRPVVMIKEEALGSNIKTRGLTLRNALRDVGLNEEETENAVYAHSQNSRRATVQGVGLRLPEEVHVQRRAGTSLMPEPLSNKPFYADTQQAAEIRARADAAWNVFKRWSDNITDAIEALSSPPEGLEDLKQRREKVKACKAEVVGVGKQHYEMVEKCLAQAAKYNVTVKMSEENLKAIATEVAQKVQQASKAISKLISRIEKEQGLPPSKATTSSKSARSLTSATAVPVSDSKPRTMTELPRNEVDKRRKEERVKKAVTAFEAWVKDKLAAIDMLAQPPKGIRDLETRVLKVGAIKTDIQSTGKRLYDECIVSLTEHGGKVPGVSESRLQELIKQVVDRSNLAEKACQKMLDMLIAEQKTKEEKSRREQEKEAKIKVEVEQSCAKFLKWAKDRLSDIDNLATQPIDLEDIKRRLDKIMLIKEDVTSTGAILFDEACATISAAGSASPVSQSKLKEQIKLLAERTKTAEKAIQKMYSKMSKEEESKSSAAEAERKKKEEEAVKKGSLEREMTSLKNWIEEKKTEIDGLATPPTTSEEMRSRVEKVAAIKDEVRSQGEERYNAVLGLVQSLGGGAGAGVDENDVHALIKEVADKVHKAGKACNKMLKRLVADEEAAEQAKQAQLEEERKRKEEAEKLLGKVDQKQSRLKGLIDDLNAEVEDLAVETVTSVRDLKRRLDRLEGVKAEIGGAGAKLYDDLCVLLKETGDKNGASKQREMKEMLDECESKATEAAETVFELLAKAKGEDEAKKRKKVEEEKQKAEEEKKKQARLEEAVAKCRSWIEEKKQSIELLSAPPQGVEDMRERVEKVSNLKKAIQSDGKQLFEECMGSAAEQELEEDIRSLANRTAIAGKACNKLLKKLEAEQERQLEEKRAQAEEERRQREESEMAMGKVEAQVSKFKGWCRDRVLELDELIMTDCKDQEEAKSRLGKVDEVRDLCEGEGRVYLDEVLSAVADTSIPIAGGSEDDLQDAMKEVRDKANETQSVLDGVINKMQQKLEQEQRELKEQQEREMKDQEAKARAEKEKADEEQAKKTRAKESFDALKAFCDQQLEAINQLKEEPKGLEDLTERVSKLDAVKEVLKSEGQKRYEEAYEAVGECSEEVSEGDVEELMTNLANKVKQANKALNGMLKMERAKERAKEEEKQAIAQQVLDEFEALKEFCDTHVKQVVQLKEASGDVEQLNEKVKELNRMTEKCKEQGKQMCDSLIQKISEFAESEITTAQVNEVWNAMKDECKETEDELHAKLQNEIAKEAAIAEGEEEKARLKEMELKQQAELEAKRKEEEEERKKQEEEERKREEVKQEEERKRKEQEEEEERKRKEQEERKKKEQEEEEERKRKEQEEEEEEERKRQEEEERKRQEEEERKREEEEERKRQEEEEERKRQEEEEEKKRQEEEEEEEKKRQEEEEKKRQEEEEEKKRQEEEEKKRQDEEEEKKRQEEEEKKRQDEEEEKKRNEEEEKKRQEEHQKEQDEEEGDAKKREAAENYESFKQWIDAQFTVIEEVSTEPKDVDDLKERLSKVTGIQEASRTKGKELYEKLTKCIDLVDSVSQEEVDARLKELSNKTGQARKAIQAMIKRMEAKERARKKKESQQEGSESAENAGAKFEEWVTSQNSAIDALASAPVDLTDMKERLSKAKGVKEELLGVGKELYDAAVSGDASKEDHYQELIRGVAEKAKKAEKAINKLIKKMESEAANNNNNNNNNNDASENGNGNVKELFESWKANLSSEIEALQTEPDGIEDAKARLEKIKEMTSEVETKGKEHFEAILEQTGDATAEEEAIKELAGKISEANKAYIRVVKRHEAKEKAAAKKKAQEEAAQTSTGLADEGEEAKGEGEGEGEGEEAEAGEDAAEAKEEGEVEEKETKSEMSREDTKKALLERAKARKAAKAAQQGTTETSGEDKPAVTSSVKLETALALREKMAARNAAKKNL